MASGNVPKIIAAGRLPDCLIGKWHLESDPTGFDYWNILPGQGDYYDPDFLKWERSQE